MNRLLIIVGFGFILLLLGLSAGVWWYLFGANKIDGAELVPANTVAFANIPNAASLVAGYETSQLKTLVNSPNAQPIHDAIVNLIGSKNLDLLYTFLPNLSGQSFIAITHFDYDHLENVGLVAAMKPKAGMGDFDAFLEKLKDTWPNVLRQGKTGTGSVDGVSYDWIQGPSALDKICVARVDGWIVTTWGEASLQDWLERYQRKSSTPSLAQDPDYQKSVARVGKNPMTILYLNGHALMTSLPQTMVKPIPIGGIALTSQFAGGEIMDHFSVLLPRQAQIDLGASVDPCSFDTLKFTGPNTRFYWAFNFNWKQFYQNIVAQPAGSSAPPPVNPAAVLLLSLLNTYAQGTGVDVQKNIIDPLGSEMSVQVEWNPDTTYPEVGFFVKLDKPDDFKPTTTAIIDSVHKMYATSAVVNELNSNGQNFASLHFVQAAPITPTITEGGPYFGVFSTENQAVRSFQRDASLCLTNNANFIRQIGDKRNGASQIMFLDSPPLLDRGYQTAMPYLSIASMFNKDIAAMLHGSQLPQDLSWLAPMGTWSCVATPDDDGFQGYSVSGIGNQGVLFIGGAFEAATVMQSIGILPKASSLPWGTPAPNPQILPTPSPSTAPLGPTSVIYITPDSKVYFDETPVDAAQLGDFLKTKKADNENLQLVVHVDKNAPSALLSQVMDAGASAGFGVLPTTSTTGADSVPPPAGDSNAEVVPAVPSDATNSTPATNSNATPAPAASSNTP
jgi:hypothetical protein